MKVNFESDRPVIFVKKVLQRFLSSSFLYRGVYYLLKLASGIFYQIFIFHQMIGLHKR